MQARRHQTVLEGVIEEFSHRDDRASRIVSAFVVVTATTSRRHRARNTCARAWTRPQAWAAAGL